jgi:hypothetical protein
MKIKKEHYDYMLEAIRPFAETFDQRREWIREEGKAKDIEKRMRWDVSWVAVLYPFFCDTLYPYLNDNHIDTALRHIIFELEGE